MRLPTHAAIDAARLRRTLQSFAGRRVAVLGDAMLDVFLWGDADRISPEAPVPVVRLARPSFALGGAANVAANIASLGGSPVLFSATGDDASGRRLRHLALRQGLELDALLQASDRPTTTKIRIFARNKHLLRCDRESTAPIPASLTRAWLLRLEAEPNLDAVVLSDYAKGCVSRELVRGVSRICARRNISWCVDPKRPGLHFRGATVLKPNRRELELLTGIAVSSPAALRRASTRLLRQQRCAHLLVTLGAAGIAWFSAQGTERMFSGAGRGVADVTGAGDTVSAVVALGLAARLPLASIARLANLAAADVVSQPGLAVATPRGILAQLS